jgi:hypothetical protein
VLQRQTARFFSSRNADDADDCTKSNPREKYATFLLMVRATTVVLMVRGSWFVVRGSWFVVRGSWFVVRGSWFVVCGLWFVVCGLWFVVLVWVKKTVRDPGFLPSLQRFAYPLR